MTVTVPANSVFRCDENTRTHRFVKKERKRKKKTQFIPIIHFYNNNRCQ